MSINTNEHIGIPMNMLEYVDVSCFVRLLNSPDYKMRFLGEYWELRIRMIKLKSMLNKYKAGKLPFTPTCSYELLYEQYIYMKKYVDILIDRAELENVDLNLPIEEEQRVLENATMNKKAREEAAKKKSEGEDNEE